MVVLTMAAMVPAGMMPVRDDIHLKIRFCVENPLLQSQTITIPRDADIDTDDGDGSCIFTGHAPIAAFFPLALEPLTHVVPSEARHMASFYVAPGLGLAAPPPFSTGPPFTAA